MLPGGLASSARIAHVGVAVRDLEQAVAFYRDVLGAVPHPAERADGADLVRVALGELEIELLSAHDAESPIGKFLARRGPGIHHICFRVPDLEAALARCREDGYELIDQSPRAGSGGRRVAFLHPRSTAGILLELTD
ncbi:MAG: methylmalonyl-CoA epimerase [Gemmatimonadales bacterium]